MTMPDQPTPADVLLRYALRLDGLAQGTLQDMLADIQRALQTVDRRLADVAGASPVTVSHLTMLRGELDALRLALSAKLSETISSSLGAVTTTAGAALADAVSAATHGPENRPAVDPAAPGMVARLQGIPVEALARIKDQPHDGMSWTRWGAKLGDDTMARLESELRQSAALGETLRERSKRLSSVFDLSRVSAERLARTAHVATANRVWAAYAQVNSDIIRGFRFLATLDGRTSPMCRALDRRFFRVGDPDIPAPPRHPNCRSLLIPTMRDEPDAEGTRPWVRSTVPMRKMGPEYRRMAKERLGDDRWRALTEAQRREAMAVERRRWQAENIGQTKAAESYPQWLARQPAEFQREVLGETRYRAFRRGLPLEAMATYDRPLTVAELRRLYPAEFQ